MVRATLGGAKGVEGVKELGVICLYSSDLDCHELCGATGAIRGSGCRYGQVYISSQIRPGRGGRSGLADLGLGVGGLTSPPLPQSSDSHAREISVPLLNPTSSFPAAGRNEPPRPFRTASSSSSPSSHSGPAPTSHRPRSASSSDSSSRYG